MLSTNQKADLINKTLSKQNKAYITNTKLSDIEFIGMHKEAIDHSIKVIKDYYDIDAKKSTIFLHGIIIIDPIQFNKQIDIKFNELNLKET